MATFQFATRMCSPFRSLGYLIVLFFFLDVSTIKADIHNSEVALSQVEERDSQAVLTPKDKRSVEFGPVSSKEMNEESFKKRTASFVPMRGKKSEIYQQDTYVDKEGLLDENKRGGFIPMRGKKEEEIRKSTLFPLEGIKPYDDSENYLMEDKRAFYAMRGKKDDSKRQFFTSFGNDGKRAFYAMRGKKGMDGEDIDEEKRAFYAMRGKKDDLKRAFYAMRGKKDYEDLDEEKRAFYAMRGKKDDAKRAFYAMRGKKDADDLDEEKRAFYAMRGKKDIYDDNKRAFYAMRGKKDVDDFVEAMRHAYATEEDEKRGGFLPMRGKRSIEDSQSKFVEDANEKEVFFASQD